MNTTRMNTIVGGALALAFVALAGCSDTATDASNTTALDKYSSYDVDATTLVQGEIPSLEQILEHGDAKPSYRETKSPDSTECGTRDDGEKEFRGSGGKHEQARGGHGPKERRAGLGELVPRSWRRAIAALDLSAEQDSLIRLCFKSARGSAIEAQRTFLTARRAIDEAMRPELQAIKEQVKAGTMTREEAREAMHAVKEQYADDVAAANDAFKAALEQIRADLKACIESYLTPDQLVLWEELT